MKLLLEYFGYIILAGILSFCSPKKEDTNSQYQDLYSNSLIQNQNKYKLRMNQLQIMNT